MDSHFPSPRRGLRLGLMTFIALFALSGGLATATVGEAPTTALTITPSPAIAGQEVTLDASGTRLDSEGNPIDMYYWDFNGDGTHELETKEPVIKHVFAAGTHNVRVAAMDQEYDWSEVYKTLQVNAKPAPAPPVVKPIPMPSVVGMKPDAIASYLAAKGVKVQLVKSGKNHDSFTSSALKGRKLGQTITQSPKAGTPVMPGKTFKLTVQWWDLDQNPCKYLDYRNVNELKTKLLSPSNNYFAVLAKLKVGKCGFVVKRTTVKVPWKDERVHDAQRCQCVDYGKNPTVDVPGILIHVWVPKK